MFQEMSMGGVHTDTLTKTTSQYGYVGISASEIGGRTPLQFYAISADSALYVEPRNAGSGNIGLVVMRSDGQGGATLVKNEQIDIQVISM